MGEAIAALLGAVLEVAMIFTGKAVVSAASFGRWRGEQLSSSEGRIHSPAGALSLSVMVSACLPLQVFFSSEACFMHCSRWQHFCLQHWPNPSVKRTGLRPAAYLVR